MFVDVNETGGVIVGSSPDVDAALVNTRFVLSVLREGKDVVLNFSDGSLSRIRHQTEMQATALMEMFY